MKGVLTLHLWNPPPRFHTLSLPSISSPLPLSISASSSGTQQQDLLTAKERRRLRNERRESKITTNWREEIEEKFIEKTKKEEKSWMEELNLDNLMKLGPQWWILRAKGQYTPEALARSMAKFFPDTEFKVYVPAINEKRKLKNGSISVKSNPLFAGCIFVRCVLNKQLHDYIKDYMGVGGFIGSQVGNTMRMIYKPKPVPKEDMEAIFKRVKVEQEEADKAFEEEQNKTAVTSADPNSEIDSDVSKAIVDSKPKRGSRKNVKLTKGSTVQIISGSFSGFEGTLKNLSHKTKIATVHLTIFGKENIVDLDVSEIAPATN